MQNHLQTIQRLVNTQKCFVYDVKQRSNEWFAMRKGRITMSTFASFLIFAKTHEEKMTIARQMCGLEKKIFTEEQIANMRVGVEYEDVVKDFYSDKIGLKIYETGMCILRENPIFGGSPDGIFENGDLCEIKITNKENPTIPYDDYSEIPLWYYWQMLGCMHITGSQRCHYVCYSRVDGTLYTRIIQYNHERWINEVYNKSCEFYRDYIAPLLSANSLPDPYETYRLLCV
jgi:hypothetical protein